jgi:hypothetical protein
MKEHNLNPKDFALDEIVSIECIGDQPTIDITVEDTHMFYANDIYTHNSSAEEDIIVGQGVADSFAKIMIGDFIMSTSRKMEDKLAGTARVHIIKSRFGSDGSTYPCNFDASCGNISIYDAKSVEGMEILNKAKTAQESIKGILRKRWNETHNDNTQPN